MSFEPQTYLSTIAVQNPASIAVFKKYGLDFCCGGARPLAEACSEINVDPQTVLAEIGTFATDTKKRNWEKEDPKKLIEHILKTYHEKHRRDLAYLIPLAAKVETVHSEKSDVPRGLHALLETVSDAMEDHMGKEENILFPWIISGGSTPPYAPVQALMTEHLGHKEKLIQLRKTCHNFRLPEDACASWKALYRGIEELIGDLMEHIHLENNILFPMALEN